MNKIEKANKKAESEIIRSAKNEVKKIANEIKKDVKSSYSKKQKKAIIDNSYKRYSKIFLLYGQKSYLKVVPAHIRLKDADELFEEGRYIEIYEKHGKKAYNDIKSSIISTDIEIETGSKFKGRMYRVIRGTVNTIKKGFVTFSTVFTTLAVGGNVILLTEADKIHKESVNQNINEINDYLDYIDDYADEIKNLNLSDTENIMIVIDDMWEKIKGYGNPEKDLMGCLGLDMYNKYGVGQCRNMADDCARKLNEINPKYNARIIAVDLNVKTDKTKLANIQQKIVQSDKNARNEENLSKSTIVNLLGNFAQSESGNHAVILMDIIDDNLTLIVDPTNPSIGMYKDGKIKMFNSLTDDGFVLERKVLGDEILRGSDSCKIPLEYLHSFLPCEISESEAEQKYGIDAQNKALYKVRKIKLNEKKFIKSLKDYNKNEYIDYEKEIEKIREKVIHNTLEKDKER